MAVSSTSADVLVPFARDTVGRWISPEDADNGEDYACPGCDALVVIRAPRDRVRHFVHVRKPDSCPLVRGSERLRRRALLSIRAVMERWIAGQGVAPRIEYACPGCRTTVGPVSLPTKVAGVRTNVLVANDSLRADAVLVDPKGEPLCIVLLKLARNSAGFRVRQLAGQRWVELDAEKLVRQPEHWIAARTGGLKAPSAHRCVPRGFEWVKRGSVATDLMATMRREREKGRGRW